MVLLWIKILDEPGQALLSLSLLVGCALGIAFVVLLRSFKRWPAGETGSRALLFVSAGILAVTSLIGGRLFDPRAIWSRATWSWGARRGGARSSRSRCPLLPGVLATVFVWAGTQKTAVIAATGPYLDAARYATASAIYKSPEYRAKWRALIAFPIAWTLGAMFVGLTSLDRPFITLIAVLTVVAVAVFARPRDPQPGTSS